MVWKKTPSTACRIRATSVYELSAGRAVRPARRRSAARSKPEPRQDEEVVAILVLDAEVLVDDLARDDAEGSVLAVDPRLHERVQQAEVHACREPAEARVATAPPAGEDDVVARLRRLRRAAECPPAVPARSQSITTVQRPRLCARPAVIAACCPKFRLSRITRTRGSRAASALQSRPRIVRASIVHEDELEVRGHGLERGREPSVELGQAPGAAVDGADDGDLGRGLVEHGRLVSPGHCGSAAPAAARSTRRGW